MGNCFFCEKCCLTYKIRDKIDTYKCPGCGAELKELAQAFGGVDSDDLLDLEPEVPDVNVI